MREEMADSWRWILKSSGCPGSTMEKVARRPFPTVSDQRRWEKFPVHSRMVEGVARQKRTELRGSRRGSMSEREILS